MAMVDVAVSRVISPASAVGSKPKAKMDVDMSSDLVNKLCSLDSSMIVG